MRVERLALVMVAIALCACGTILGIDKNYVLGDGDAAGPDSSPGDVAPPDAGGCNPVDGAYVFCDNFDDTPLGANWSAIQTTFGTVALDTTGPVSPPNAFSATLDVIDASNTGRSAKLVRGFLAAKSLDCTFAYKLVTEGIEPMRLVSINVVNSAVDSYELNLYIDPNYVPYIWEWAIFPDGGNYDQSSNLAALFVLDTWVRVEIYIEYGNTIRVLVNGTLAGQMSALAQTPQGETLILGAFSIGTSKWKMLYDDLVCVATM